MYSTVGLLRNAKKSGRITGTHQKLDRIAYSELSHALPRRAFFPTINEILHFEGNRGPDGLKWKSPGVDEPMHFILPDNDDGKLWQMIFDHQYNLRQALKKHDSTRAAFEAAWMAHAITDGLTPAHHFPYLEVISELMSDKEYVKIFGKPFKGIMRGNNLIEAVRNNWLYLGAEGYMTKHIAFEYGVAVITTSQSSRSLSPHLTKNDLKDLNFKRQFYESLEKVAQLDMYTRFRKQGWTNDLAHESKHVLLPEIIRCIALGWCSAIPDERSQAAPVKQSQTKKAKSTKRPQTEKTKHVK